MASRPRKAKPGAGSPADPARPALFVGLGASAGGLEALQQFFANVPADAGLVFVVVQHLEPHHPSLLVELLGRYTSLPIALAADGFRPEGNRVYVIPPGTLLTLVDGAFRVTAAREPNSQAPIDRFFRSLADETGERAVGIVFSGAGHDGTAGLRAIKERGGLTLAQSPETAKHDSMPESAIAAGLVDHVLAPNEMAAKLLEHAGYLATEDRGGSSDLEAELANSRLRICELVQQQSGHDFAKYKEGTLLRRIRRRMQVLGMRTVNDYVRRLAQDPAEAESLVKDLLIGVTQFFRDPEAFEALAQQVIPLVVQAKASDAPVRIWVAGCASGEEAYSIAMQVAEHLERLGAARFVQIFATDLDAELLAEARLGRYPLSIAEQVSPERLARFFVRHDRGYQAGKQLRDMCIFSEHSLIRDPPFSQLDLISCRNVLIYLNADLQKKLVPLFHYALRPGGFLFLGPSEGIAGTPDLFETTDKKSRIFRRRETVSRPVVEFPLAPRVTSRPLAAASAESSRGNPAATLQQRAGAAFERMTLDEYAAPSVVVNSRAEVVFIAGRTGRFFQPPSGIPSSNVLEMVPPSLRTELRSALHAAAANQRRVVRDDVPVDLEDGLHRVRLTVRPLPGIEFEAGLLAVVIQEQLPLDAVDETDLAAGAPDQPAVDRLESELRTTRAELKSTVEDLESTNEELKSSNEELISTNEELQSANEELQTSKEELQSLNEELETVNTELRQKLDELATANSDLQNLFASTEVATIFLDRELRVAKFTPAATALFHLLDADVGRPLADLAPRFEGQDLVADCRQVLRSLTPVQRQVQSAGGGAWFMLRILPYRTVANVIAGVVVTFVDVTELKRAEEALREGEERFRLLVEGVRDYAIFMLSPDGTVATWNAGAERLKGYRAEEIIGQPYSRFFAPEDVQAGTPRREFEEAAAHGRFQGEGWRIRKDGSRFLASLVLTAIRDDSGALRGFAKVTRDITERKAAEEALRASEDRFRTMVNTIPQLAWMARADGFIYWYNDGWYEYTGTTPQQMEGWGWQSVHDPDVLPKVLEQWKGSIASGEPFDMVFPLRGADGKFRPFLTRVQPLKDSAGKVVQWFGTNTDVSEIEEARSAARDAEERLRMAQVAGRVGTFEWNLRTGVNTWSPELEAMYGLPPGGFAKSQPAWESLVHPEDRAFAVKRVEETFESGQPVDGEWRVVWPDGSVHWIAGRFQAFKDAAGKPSRLTGVNIDITERKKRERAVVLEEVFRFAPSFFHILRGPQFVFEFANEAYYQLVGERDLMGRPAFEVLPDAAGQGFEERLAEVMRTREPFIGRELPVMLTPPPGSALSVDGRSAEAPSEERFVDLFYAPLINEDGSCDRVLGLGTDVTEQVRARRRYEARLAANLDALQRMHALSGKFVATGEFQPLLQEVMDAAVAIAAAEKGTLQLFEDGTLKIVANCGHEPPFLDFFSAAENVASVCGEATRRGERVVVPDVETSDVFAGTPSLPVLRAAGVRAVQSTPLSARDGRLLGILTTHWSVPHAPDEHDLWRIDLLARQAADLIEQKRAEEALKRSEKTFSELVERAPFGIYIVDSAFRIAHMNAGSQNGAFRNVRPIIGRPFNEAMHTLWPDAVAEEIIGHFRHTLDTGEPYFSPRFTNPRADVGIVESYEWELRRIELPDGQYGVICYYFDSTELRTTEAKLRQSEHQAREESVRLSTLINSMRDEVWLVDADRNLTLANPSVMREFLLPDGTLDAERLAGGFEVLRADGTPRPVEEAPPFRALRGETLDGVEEIVRTPATGELRHRMVSAAPIKDSGGAITGSVSVVRDITDLKRSAQALERSREGMSQLANASLRVMRETDLDAMFQAISAAALEITGARITVTGHGYVSGRFTVGGASRTPGMPDCPPGKEFTIEKGGVYMALIEGTADSIRLTDEELHAHPRWWGLPQGHVPMRGLLGVRLTDRAGRTNGMILVTNKEHGEFTAEDESRLLQLGTLASLAAQHVEARIALEEADRSKNEFLAILSHELRNPLAPIASSIYLLDRAVPGSEQAKRAHAVIDRQVTHLTRLVDDLLDLTRISRGKILLQKARLDFAGAVRRAIEDHGSAFASAGVHPVIAIPHDPIPIDGDPTRVAQIIGNLLQNAVKFTGPGGAVAVSVDRNDSLGEAIARVRDTGAGIPGDMLLRIFEPFTQGDRTLDRSMGGLGLGLALVKGLVEMHGGTVSVVSEGIGKGAEFTVRFPLALGPERRPDAAAITPGGRKLRRILIVEDNIDAAEMLREVLELQGHTVDVAFAGAEGVEKARSVAPDVVLCDIGLPGMSGYEVARRMRAEPALSRIRLVALSGYATPDDVAKSREAGFDVHLAKPPSVAKIEEALGG